MVVVSEYLDELSGVDVMFDWECEYLYKNFFCLVFGSVFSFDEGLLFNLFDYYLLFGYS